MITWRYNPETHNFYSHNFEYLKSFILQRSSTEDYHELN
jgi:hypothetical protein